jgi:hypothetical protein
MHHEQAHRAARLISVNNRLTLPSHSVPSVRFATVPISGKPAASAKSWYLLSSWFAPAPGEPRPEGRRGPAPQMRYARRPHGHKLEGADPRYPRIRAFALTTRQPALRAATPGFTQAQHCRGRLGSGSFRWKAIAPPREGLPQSPCTRPRPPAGPRPFNRPGGPPRRFTHLCPGDAANFAEVSPDDR